MHVFYIIMCLQLLRLLRRATFESLTCLGLVSPPLGLEVFLAWGAWSCKDPLDPHCIYWISPTEEPRVPSITQAGHVANLRFEQPYYKPY